jgi:TRAP-type C4-dicarboxylate transport system permease small subunit
MTMVFLKTAGKIYDLIVTALAVMAGILLVFMILSVSWEVITRYFLNNPTIWVIEISEYTLLYLTFLVGPPRSGSSKFQSTPCFI